MSSSSVEGIVYSVTHAKLGTANANADKGMDKVRVPIRVPWSHV